jgi:hypothetical protein
MKSRNATFEDLTFVRIALSPKSGSLPSSHVKRSGDVFDRLRDMFWQFTAFFYLTAVLSYALYGQPKSATTVSTTASISTKKSTDMGAEVLAFERAMEAAVVRGDLAYIDSVSAQDLTFTHGDGWTTGGKPLLIDDRKAFLKRVENRIYAARDLDSVNVEMHGDIAITYGHYVAQYRTGTPARMWFSVWFERDYAKRDGQWLFVSHRTVHGPTFGPDRQSVEDK